MSRAHSTLGGGRSGFVLTHVYTPHVVALGSHYHVPAVFVHVAAAEFACKAYYQAWPRFFAAECVGASSVGTSRS